MKLNEFVRSLDTWTSKEEQRLLDSIQGLVSIHTFEEHDQFVIEALIRKSLIIKVQGANDESYVYPNR
jgi:hypothetical protein